jgi:hypothetical protein
MADELSSKDSEAEFTSYRELMVAFRPGTFGDVCKAIAWAFVVGFNERFVPNYIDRLSQEVRRSQPPPEAGR